MSDEVLPILEQQPDLSKIKLISKGSIASVYKVKQTTEKGERKQFLRVMHDIRNYQAIKREKDLLHYLNQFPEFIHFNEIRKVGYSYLQFFDFAGKRNLKQTIKKSGSLSARATKKLLEDMVAILERVHSVGFVHGDIEPSNIVMGKKQAYLVDWSHSIPSLSSFDTEMIKGDKKYCPPERLNGQLDEAGDVYSLGCTLYFALTGKHIYRLDKENDEDKQLWAHVHHTVHKMNKLPIFWRYLIFWMTQKDPAKRPGLVDLKQWLEDLTVPEWVRQMSVRVDKSYPEEPMTVLADEHYMYPIFKKALESENSGDLDTAFNLYENCAFRDYSRAENNLGRMYEQGKPVRQSYAMAANMYQQAFEKGNPYAAYNLGRLFEKGLGMPKNVEHAFKLYRFAAIRGNLQAQNALAMMYLDGRGTVANIAQARSWLGLAAQYGHSDAKKNIRMLLKESKRVL
ncbi:Sel1-like repeat-containing protein kinase family protein [Thiomicrorhabdus sp. Milos-T2]|uniref:Sel1-like repeat-containing protein kinase family protein n=1 Tax=Thiomicrorhabdus sp. Milos-T2 TaxID=90814 RepID=UPI00049498CB|nr:Sel1-like repeat-containing protein kinase family protein [Thiomicrorhabdus sp. Milos-T2]